MRIPVILALDYSVLSADSKIEPRKAKFQQKARLLQQAQKEGLCKSTKHECAYHTAEKLSTLDKPQENQCALLAH